MKVDSFANLNNQASLPSEKNTIVKKETEGEEQQVVIPAGFIQADDSADTLEEGIVIEDASEDSTKKGNQFVWVPVNQKLAFKEQEEESGTIELGRYDFGKKDDPKLDGPKEENAEIDMTYNSSYKATEVEDKNIEEFKKQTNLAKGYYIGRYEMGQGGVCKANQTVYNNVTRNQAKEESQNLYNEVKKGTETIYTSDLINSYAWDTAIVYIMKTTGENEYAYQGDEGGSSAIATGTKGDEKCKIHDMAKNVCEWTTEYSSSTSVPCVSRGGGYNDNRGYTSYRGNGSTSNGFPHIGFRCILYIVGLNA